MVRTLLTAVGDPTDIETGGPVNYAMDALEPNVQAELTAQRFLGLRLRCAQCHDHPFDVWTQDAYYGLASFFAKVQRGGGGRADDGHAPRSRSIPRARSSICGPRSRSSRGCSTARP